MKTRCLRSGIILKIIWLVLLITTAGLLFFAETRPWALSAFVLAVGSSLALRKLREKIQAIEEVSNRVQTVYWGQERLFHDEVTLRVLAGRKPVRLHLGNGNHLDVDVAADEVDYFTRWINQGNPYVFWGVQYENKIDV